MYGRPLYVKRKRLDVSVLTEFQYVRKSNQSKTRKTKKKQLRSAFGRRRRNRLKLNGFTTFTCVCATEMPSEREQKPNKIFEQKIMKSSVCSALLSAI